MATSANRVNGQWTVLVNGDPILDKAENVLSFKIDCLWGPPSCLSNWYQGRFPRRKSGRDVKLTTYLHLLYRSRMHGTIGLITPSHIFTAWCYIKHINNITFTFYQSSNPVSTPVHKRQLNYISLQNASLYKHLVCSIKTRTAIISTKNW